MSDIEFWEICTHRNVLYAQRYADQTSLFKYDESREYETKSDSHQHITRINVKFQAGFCVIRDLIVTIRSDQAQLYLFSLEGDVVKSETMPIFQDKYIINSYNEDCMLVWDKENNELWVVQLNGKATKINIDAVDPWWACFAGKNLFVYCCKTKGIIKYVSC